MLLAQITLSRNGLSHVVEFWQGQRIVAVINGERIAASFSLFSEAVEAVLNTIAVIESRHARSLAQAVA